MNDQHPIQLVINDYSLQRSRLTVLFRLLLAVPHYVWQYLWSVAALIVAIVNWFATLFLGRSPDPLHNFLAGFLRYNMHVSAYIRLLANPFPGFSGAPGYPIDLVVAPPEPQNRLVTFFRFVLALPAWVSAGILGWVSQTVAFFGWIVCLVLGRMPEGLQNLGVFCLRYQAQAFAYLYLLTARYPLSGQGPQASEGPTAA